jgi:hypothetical protein
LHFSWSASNYQTDRTEGNEKREELYVKKTRKYVTAVACARHPGGKGGVICIKLMQLLEREIYVTLPHKGFDQNERQISSVHH